MKIAFLAELAIESRKTKQNQIVQTKPDQTKFFKYKLVLLNSLRRPTFLYTVSKVWRWENH